jgi:FxsC-like protein
LGGALALGTDHPAYAENGLRALLKIGLYRDSYEAVVSRLAARIVVLSENFPIQPHEVQDIDDMTSPFSPDSRLAVFAIETAAPTTNTVAAGHDPRGYGEDSADWRPFPRQELTLAEYAGQIVERLDFKAEVSGIKPPPQGTAVRRPGIILIDPWFVADDNGRLALESAVNNLPRWVLPLVVVNQPSDARTRELAGQVRDILATAGALPTDSSRRAAEGVHSLREFVSIVRVLVAEAEKQYLRHRSGQYRSRPIPSSPSGNRPSLRRPIQRDRKISPSSGSASEPDSWGEIPHD